MGARFVFTSRLDGAARLFIGLPVLVLLMFSFGAAVFFILGLVGINANNEPYDWAVGIGGFAGGGWLYGAFFSTFLDTFIAYLYLRAILWVDVNWREAKSLSRLFVGNKSGTWYPLTEVRSIPRNQRKDYVYAFAQRLEDK